jgi:probable HAF family extracellular repeat protein
MQDLGTLGGTDVVPHAINDLGQVVGSSQLTGGGGTPHAFLYDRTATPAMQDLGTFGGTLSLATGINNRSQVVGLATLVGNTTHAFLYDPTATPAMQDLGTLGGPDDSEAEAINAAGQVVGTSGDAFLYDPTATPPMRDLGALDGAGTEALGINDSGQVVGLSTGARGVRAFLYDPTATPVMQDLNDLIPGSSGWVLQVANEINDRGQILGHGTIHGETHDFLLTPVQPPSITSAARVTFTVGSAGSFTVTATGLPAPALGVSGALPGGVAFTDNGDGTATLAGTPAAGSGGVYHLTILAGNQGGAATQQFTLTVNEAPAVTSASSATFLVGVAGSFTVTTFGFPFPVLGASGPVPEGLAFIDNGDGTASLAGTPEQDSAGTNDLVILAANALGYATQHFTVTVSAAPAPHRATRPAAFLDPTLVDAMAWPVERVPWGHRRTGSGPGADGLEWSGLG